MIRHQRRFVRLFQPRFATMVKSGRKHQTVRATPKRMPQWGDLISLRAWTGVPYQSKQVILRESVITFVEPVQIAGLEVRLNGRLMTKEGREWFAQQDGFASFLEMTEWIDETHGLPFDGIVIYWSVEEGEG